MSDAFDLRADLTDALLQRPATLDAITRNRARREAGPRSSAVSTDRQGEHATGALLEDAMQSQDFGERATRAQMVETLQQHPRALQALRANRLRNLERHATPAAPSTTGATCPWCDAPGEPVQVMNSSGTFAMTVTRLRPDCCPDALLDSAQRALRYARNPDGPTNERTENAQRYLQLRGQITRREDLAQLDALEAELKRRAANRGPSYARTTPDL